MLYSLKRFPESFVRDRIQLKRCAIKLKDEEAEIEVTGSPLEEEANMAKIEVTGSRLEEEANGGNRRGLVRCSDLAAQHRRIIYSFGSLLIS